MVVAFVGKQDTSSHLFFFNKSGLFRNAVFDFQAFGDFLVIFLLTTEIVM